LRFCFFLVLPLAAFADSITVAVAANVQFTVQELKAEFTKETGIGVKTIIGSSGKIHGANREWRAVRCIHVRGHGLSQAFEEWTVLWREIRKCTRQGYLVYGHWRTLISLKAWRTNRQEYQENRHCFAQTRALPAPGGQCHEECFIFYPGIASKIGIR